MLSSRVTSDPSAYTIRNIDAVRGDGVFAARALPAGTLLFTEYPLIAMQHAANKKKGVSCCERCFRFLGPLESQVCGLLRGRKATQSEMATLPEKLPHVDGAPVLRMPVGCAGGCGLQYCSKACADADFAAYHKLLCPARVQRAADDKGANKRVRPDVALQRAANARIAPPIEDSLTSMSIGGDAAGDGSAMVDVSDASGTPTPKPAASGASGTLAGASGSSGGTDDDGGLEGLLSVLPEDALTRFHAHASATNEIFALAGKACAMVLCALDGVPAEGMLAAYEHAMLPFSAAPVWWEAIATPDDVADEAHFRRTLRTLLTESWTLLAAVLVNHVPAGCPLFASDRPYAQIVGSFERRNCSVCVTSPVEAYLLAADAMPDADPAKASVTAVTGPLLDALGDSYWATFDGTGLFPLQATMNHNCEPNVSLLKEEDEEECDGRVVARTTRDVDAGEELCNSYVDVTLPLRRRRRELREYGFECDCARCARELAAAAAEKAARGPGDKKAGKKRLK